jgi:hypothetical protein
MWSNEFYILQSGKTALIQACYKEESEIVGLLSKAGARTDIQDKVAIAQSAFDWLAICDNVTEWPDCPLLGCP